MEEVLNESQPVCPICGGDCNCESPIDWEELERENNALLEAVIPICEAAEARKKEALLSAACVTVTLQ